MLGPESAYRSLRRDELDFIEVGTRAEAEAAVLQMLREPARYASMRQRARERAAECTVERVTGRWLQVLQADVPALGGQAVVQRWHRRPVFWRNSIGRVRRWLHRRP